MLLSLTLSLDQFSVTLTDFDATGYERIPAQVGDVEYSLHGSAIETGSLFEPKFVWTISAYVTREQWRQLWAMYQRQERRRRTQQSYGVTIDDHIENFVEDTTTRSRSIASGGIVTSSNGCIEYPARFSARIYEPKNEATRNLQYPYIARFVLKELDKVAP